MSLALRLIPTLRNQDTSVTRILARAAAKL